MRECARKLHLHRTTIQRKKTFLALESLGWLKKFRDSKRVKFMQFDDMETFEHTKCKPISITLAVERRTRLVLGFAASMMPAKGKLARMALEKYGPRPDHRKAARRNLFAQLQPVLTEDALIESDQNPHYVPDVLKFFPNASHRQHKGRRGCVVGQGELKRGGYDPLFSLNHTCAMFRANMNRLFRRTWCTTKKIEGLVEHLALYACSHNQRILAKMAA